MEMDYDESGWQQGRPKQQGEDEVSKNTNKTKTNLISQTFCINFRKCPKIIPKKLYKNVWRNS